MGGQSVLTTLHHVLDLAVRLWPVDVVEEETAVEEVDEVEVEVVDLEVGEAMPRSTRIKAP
jgi:hypothetical protein